MDRPKTPIGTPQGFYVHPVGRGSMLCGIRVPGLWLPAGPPVRNLVMYDWATVAAKLLAGDLDYKLATMYFEFRNLDDPDTDVDAPSYGRGDGIAYYEGLSDSADTDYVRVPLTAVTVTSANTTRYPGGNVTNAIAQTSGVTGVNGKSFSDTVNSKVFGGALVASPDPNDASRDLIVSRFYFPAGSQLPKLAGSQLGLNWPLAQE